MLRCDAEGKCRLFMRQSSQEPRFFPEGEGYLMFSTLPSGAPPLAKLKRRDEWPVELVMGTVWPFPRCLLS